MTTLCIIVCVCVHRSIAPLTIPRAVISEEESGGDRDGAEMEGGRREDVFTSVGMCILTSRSCDSTGDGGHTTETRKTAHRQSLPETEVFVPITEEVCESVHSTLAYINSCK